MDDFEDVLLPVPIALPIVTLVIAAALLVFNTVVLVLFIYYWNKPSIKATSLYLSALILTGCYVLCVGILFGISRELLDILTSLDVCVKQRYGSLQWECK